MHSLKETRKNMVESLEDIISQAQRRKEIISSGQLNLFGALSELPIETSTNGNGKHGDPTNEFTQKEMCLMEKELTGFYISSHPMDGIPEMVLKSASCTLSDISELPDGSEVIIYTIISDITKRLTKTNKLICIVQLEDTLGKAEAVIFS